ncbi:MAG: DUF4859 domain-containing protein [Bacteroidaceae bacterium]|nr:DUF4859 domain-containing protein [Bacteroidaceae bacterium]
MKQINLLCLVAIAMLCTIGARAQYKIEMDQVPLSNYRSVAYDFSLTEICAALDVDTATFANDFYDFNTYPDLVTLETDNHSTNYTQGDGGRGYWMTPDGKAQAWPNCTFCVLPYPDTESDLFTFAFWQMPDVAVVGDVYHCVIAVNYNNKQLTFDITVNVVEKEAVNVETELAKLNILGTIETTTTQEPRSDWTPDKITMDISEAIQKLGFDAEKLSKELSDYIYMGWVNQDEETKEAKLSNKWTANSGFWTGLFYDDTVGEETGELINGWGSAYWKVYIEAFKLDASTGILTANVGQNPNQVQKGVHWWIPMYLINGNNAYILRVNFNSTEPDPEDEPIDFDKQTKVGEQDIVIDEWPNNSYKPWKVTLDIDSIAELIGSKKSDINLRAEAAEGEISFNTTANNGGYWLDKDGFVCVWGNGSVLSVEPADGLRTLNCMQMPGVVKVGDVYTYRLYLVGKQAHYQLNFTINIGEQPSYDFSEYTLVADEVYEFQIVPSDGEWDNEHMKEGIQLGAEHLTELLGDGSYTFLGEQLGDNEQVLISDEYTCDPHPAFWMTGQYIHAHNGQNSYGILYNASAGKFTFVKQPGFNQVGESYVGNFWLANPSTKKYIHYSIYVEYVDEIVNYQVVGNETMALPLHSEDGDFIETPIDMTACLAALGCEMEEFLENGTWKVMNAKGKFTTEGYEDEMYGFWFDNDGNPTSEENAKIYSVEFLDAEASDCGQNCFRTSSFDNETRTVKICAEFSGKRYVFNLTLCDDPSGIIELENERTEELKNGSIYDLTGRKIVNGKLPRGIYIINGQRFLVN